MKLKQFRQDFFRGLGSAIEELKTCSQPEIYRETVLYGCLHNTCYDWQCEGDRGDYLYEACRLVGQEEYFVSQLVGKYETVSGSAAFAQMTSLLYYFASGGCEGAARALNEKYDVLYRRLCSRKMRSGFMRDYEMFECLCVWLTSLSGMAALKKIAEDVGRGIGRGEIQFFYMDWFYRNAQRKLGKKKVAVSLEKAAARSENVALFLKCAGEFEEKTYGEKSPPTLEDVLENAYVQRDGLTWHGRGGAMRFARAAGEQELYQLAEAALQEKDPKKQVELLWPFCRIPFPLPAERIFELIDSRHREVRDVAFRMLALFPSPSARDLALSLIRENREMENAIQLLAKNFRREDEPLLDRAVRSIPVNQTSGWHSVFMDAEEVFRSGRWKPQTKLLQYLYRKTLCSDCRLYIVESMKRHGCLEESILMECRWDCNFQIRRLAEKIEAGRGIHREFTS